MTDATPLEPVPSVRPKRRFWPGLEGVFWLMGGLILLTQGWMHGLNLVALIACLLLALYLLNLFWTLARPGVRKLRLHRRVERPVFAKARFTVQLDLENPSGWNQPGLRIIDQGRSHRHGWFLSLLRRRTQQSNKYQVTISRRGRYLWPPLVLSTGYPFGLVRQTLTYDEMDETIVLPTLGRLHRGRLRKLLQSQPQPVSSTKRPVRRHPESQTEFYGLREFRQGDSPRWIHWRTSARIGELMVREFEEPPLENLTVVVEPWLPAPAEQLYDRLRRVIQENEEIIGLLLATGPPPSPQKRAAKEAALARKEEPLRRPLEMLERAVSFAATVCWEWSRHPGARLALVIAGPNPSVQVIETSRSRVFPLLESLALTQGATDRHLALPVNMLLGQSLREAAIPAGPVLLVSTRPTGLGDLLSGQLRRPVATLDVAQPEIHDFYEDRREA